ncbi:hypothetical protein F5Y14DRAFT_21410 [Nemania sp. NC0429]|nr:hypothetical protein F5Y14DRAFT_21410 [Nemania sp. NC0429]
MLDPWDELETLQRGRRDLSICSQELENIRGSCIQEHGKNHVAECAECWTRLVNRMRDRYLNSAIKEWFSGRRAFLQELDDLFAKAREHEVDFKTIEQRIADEKKEWLRDKVRNLGLQTATKSPAEARTLQQKLNDRDIPADQLVHELRECLGVNAEPYNEVFSTFSKQVKAAQPPSARAHAYIEALFQPERDPAAAAKSQKYIDMITNGKPIAEVINTMVRDRQSTKGGLEQRQVLQKKLEELRRARAAHELDKNKRDQVRQEKARAAMSNAAYTLPRCEICDQPVNPRNFLSCPVCQLLGDHYKLPWAPIVFCSEECYEDADGYDTHVKSAHHCSSGQSCLNLAHAGSEMDESLMVFCRECVEDLEQDSQFCSSSCYNKNFKQHRERVHIPWRERRNRETDDEDQLAFDPQDHRRYTAKKIEDHVILIRDVFSSWQQKTEASVSPRGAVARFE